MEALRDSGSESAGPFRMSRTQSPKNDVMASVVKCNYKIIKLSLACKKVLYFRGYFYVYPQDYRPLNYRLQCKEGNS